MTDFGKSAKGPTLTDLTSVASNATNINTVATNMQDVQDVATEINASPTLRNLMDSVLNDTITLDGLTDTNLGTLTSAENGYSLNYDHSTTKWVPTAVSTGSSITQLSDLDVTDPTTNGDGLKWDGSAYVAANFAEIGVDLPTPATNAGFIRSTSNGYEFSVPVANLTSTDANAVLAASQGKALKDLIDGIGDITVVADNTARGNLTGLDVGDIIHTESDSGFGNSWTRYQITSISGGTTFATATSVLIAKSTDFSNANLVSIIDDAPIGAAADSAIGTITIRPNLNGTATQLQLQCDNTSFTDHLVTIEGPAHGGGFTGYTLKLPDAAPTAGQMLVASSNYATDDKLEFVDQPAAGATVGVAAAMAIVF